VGSHSASIAVSDLNLQVAPPFVPPSPIGNAQKRPSAGAEVMVRFPLPSSGEQLFRRWGFDGAADSSSRMPFSIRMWETASGGCYRGVLKRRARRKPAQRMEQPPSRHTTRELACPAGTAPRSRNSALRSSTERSDGAAMGAKSNAAAVRTKTHSVIVIAGMIVRVLGYARPYAHP